MGVEGRGSERLEKGVEAGSDPKALKGDGLLVVVVCVGVAVGSCWAA